jgi:hypothetical protein
MVPDLIEPTKEIPGLCPFVLRDLHEMRQLILATRPIRVACEDLGLSVPPGEIVGQVENSSLEAIRRLGWRALDRVCDLIMVIRLSIHGRIYGPEPPTAADLKRKADYERLVRVFPVIGGAIELIKPCRGEVETAI